MAEKFDFFSLPYTANPFGVIFHPLAIERLVDRAIDGQAFSADELNKRDDVWYSFQAHSSLSGIEAEQVVENLNTGLSNLKSALKEASHIVITLGTAWVYRLKETDELVANCHKEPGNLFDKQLLSPKEITESTTRLIEKVRQLNVDSKFIWSVSPVRHTKDGMVENARSKAHLLTGVHHGLEASDDAFYFPAYEILMDELRDYRYYNSDLVHPNNQAIYHVWEAFKTAWIHKEAQQIFNQVGGIKAAMNHKTQLPGSNAHRDFKRQLQERIEEFRADYPHIKI